MSKSAMVVVFGALTVASINHGPNGNSSRDEQDGRTLQEASERELREGEERPEQRAEYPVHNTQSLEIHGGKGKVEVTAGALPVEVQTTDGPRTVDVGDKEEFDINGTSLSIRELAHDDLNDADKTDSTKQKAKA